jgi:hypothetical protein
MNAYHSGGSAGRSVGKRRRIELREDGAGVIYVSGNRMPVMNNLPSHFDGGSASRDSPSQGASKIGAILKPGRHKRRWHNHYVNDE